MFPIAFRRCRMYKSYGIYQSFRYLFGDMANLNLFQGMEFIILMECNLIKYIKLFDIFSKIWNLRTYKSLRYRLPDIECINLFDIFPSIHRMHKYFRRY